MYKKCKYHKYKICHFFLCLLFFRNYFSRFSLMTPNNGPCGSVGQVGYSPWGPSQHQYVENFYNNPIQYPTNGSSNNVHRFPPNHQPPLPNANGTSCYPQHQQTTKSCHSHYPSNHAHSVEYQPYHPNNGINRKCGNARMCSSYDALTSPQQPLLPNPANWANSQPKTNGSSVGGSNGGTHKCNKQNSQQQLYQCSSECSDHSLKSHSQHSHSSQERSKNTNCKESCHQRSSTNKHHTYNGKTINHCTTNGNDILNGNDNIYENDDETTEHDRMITSTSDCCSSAGEVDGDSSCCSCSLYAEAGEPTTNTTATTTTQSTSNNQLAKVAAQN